MRKITDVAAGIGIPEEQIEQYGHYMAKIPVELTDEGKVKKSNLILVTAITATKAGIGKTTASIGLALGLNCAVTAVALAAVWAVRSAYLPLLGSLQEGYLSAAMWPTLLCGAALCGLMVIFDAAAVRRRIARLRPDVRPGRRGA